MFDDEMLKLKMLEEFFYKLSYLSEDFQNYFTLRNKRKKKKNKENLRDKFMNFFSKIFTVLVLFLLIVYLYYHFIFWNLIPKLESSNIGLVLDFWNIEEIQDENHYEEIKNFIIFHIIIVMMIWSLLKTLFSNCGNLDKEFIETFSGVNILSSLIYYLENFDSDSENNFDLKEIQNLKNSDIQILAEKYCILMDLIISSHETIKTYLHDKSNNSFTSNEDYICCDNLVNICKKDLNFKKKISEKDRKNKEILMAIKNLHKQIKNFFNSHPIHMNYLTQSLFYDMNSENDRFCNFCLLRKPDRTHHCKTCRRCVRKMDHHCAILGICIGYSNYKPFILLLIYSTILAIFSFFNSINFCKFYFDEYNFPFYGIIYCLYIVNCGILSLVLFTFTCYHLKLIFMNLTTREDKIKIGNLATNKYDLGYYKNFSEVFGKNIFIWLIPLVEYDEMGGYRFEIDENTFFQYKNKDFSQDNSLYRKTDHSGDYKHDYSMKI